MDLSQAISWDIISVIGKGENSADEYIAIKQIDIETMNKNQIDAIQAEIEIMKHLSHPNIVQYYFNKQEAYNHRINILMEYAQYGSIRQFYHKNGKLSTYEIIYCLKSILAGLAYLHENGFAHRDIKAANCLLFHPGVVKLADFGASKKFESESIVSGLKGTPNWMAPEVIKGTQMTSGWIKADVWSLGCTVVEMLTGKVPYAEYDNPMTAMYRIASGEMPKVKKEDSFLSSIDILSLWEGLIEFVTKCCAVDPLHRPSIAELQQFTNFTSMDFALLPTRLFSATTYDVVDEKGRVISDIGVGMSKKTTNTTTKTTTTTAAGGVAGVAGVATVTNKNRDMSEWNNDDLYAEINHDMDMDMDNDYQTDIDEHSTHQYEHQPSSKKVVGNTSFQPLLLPNQHTQQRAAQGAACTTSTYLDDDNEYNNEYEYNDITATLPTSARPHFLSEEPFQVPSSSSMTTSTRNHILPATEFTSLVVPGVSGISKMKQKQSTLPNLNIQAVEAETIGILSAENEHDPTLLIAPTTYEQLYDQQITPALWQKPSHHQLAFSHTSLPGLPIRNSGNDLINEAGNMSREGTAMNTHLYQLDDSTDTHSSVVTVARQHHPTTTATHTTSTSSTTGASNIAGTAPSAYQDDEFHAVHHPILVTKVRSYSDMSIYEDSLPITTTNTNTSTTNRSMKASQEKMTFEEANAFFSSMKLKYHPSSFEDIGSDGRGSSGDRGGTSGAGTSSITSSVEELPHPVVVDVVEVVKSESTVMEEYAVESLEHTSKLPSTSITSTSSSSTSSRTGGSGGMVMQGAPRESTETVVLTHHGHTVDAEGEEEEGEGEEEEYQEDFDEHHSPHNTISSPHYHTSNTTGTSSSSSISRHTIGYNTGHINTGHSSSTGHNIGQGTGHTIGHSSTSTAGGRGAAIGISSPSPSIHSPRIVVAAVQQPPQRPSAPLSGEKLSYTTSTIYIPSTSGGIHTNTTTTSAAWKALPLPLPITTTSSLGGIPSSMNTGNSTGTSGTSSGTTGGAMLFVPTHSTTTHGMLLPAVRLGGGGNMPSSHPYDSLFSLPHEVVVPSTTNTGTTSGTISTGNGGNRGGGGRTRNDSAKGTGHHKTPRKGGTITSTTPSTTNTSTSNTNGSGNGRGNRSTTATTTTTGTKQHHHLSPQKQQHVQKQHLTTTTLFCGSSSGSGSGSGPIMNGDEEEGSGGGEGGEAYGNGNSGNGNGGIIEYTPDKDKDKDKGSDKKKKSTGHTTGHISGHHTGHHVGHNVGHHIGHSSGHPKYSAAPPSSTNGNTNGTSGNGNTGNGYRSFSANPVLSGSQSNHHLFGSSGGHGNGNGINGNGMNGNGINGNGNTGNGSGKKKSFSGCTGGNNNQPPYSLLPGHVGMKLPPLPHTSQESSGGCGGEGGSGCLGSAGDVVRYVQSAPAVSRSVNLPPIQPSTFLQALLPAVGTGNSAGQDGMGLVSTSANMVPFSISGITGITGGITGGVTGGNTGMVGHGGSGLASKTPKLKRLKPIYNNVYSTGTVDAGMQQQQQHPHIGGGNMSGRRLQQLQLQKLNMADD